MKLSANIIIGFLFITATLYSCGEYPCKEASDYIGLISFTPAETDTIIIRRVTKSTNFSIQKDSLFLNKSNANFQQNGDTVLVLAGSNDGNAIITSDYDYEIFLPGANVTYTLSDIVEPLQYGRGGKYKVLCINSIDSYKLNGQLVHKKNAYGPIYITK